MKRFILLAALAASFTVHAVTFEKPNKAGGHIVLTDRPAKDCKANMKVVYATNEEGEVLFGCWALIDNRIWISISNEVRIHDPNSFTVIKDKDSVKPTRAM